jgi:signal transduction histidine kinase
VAAGSEGQHSRRSLSDLTQQFAALLQADRDAILAAFAERLAERLADEPGQPGSRERAMALASDILTDIVTRIQQDGERVLFPRLVGALHAEGQLSPADLLRTMADFSGVVMSELARHVADDPELLGCLVSAVLIMNESIARLLKQALAAYTSDLIEQVDQGYADERLRISRDIHDRLGEGLSVALRQLELQEIDTAAAARHTALAKDAIIEGMSRLRAVAADLRQEPVRNLETALVTYLDSVAADAEVRLRVSGDEMWVPPEVIDEVYQVTREALRNAFTHSHAKLVLVGITMAPHEISAWVEADGSGFEVAGSAGHAGSGLSAMRERAAVAGGRLTLISVPGQGTYVGLVVALPGHHHEPHR